jgi:hypothetical protein
MPIANRITNVIPRPTSQEFSGDGTLTNLTNTIRLNALSNDVTLTLPPVTQEVAAFGNILIERVDDFTNINNLCKVVTQTPSNLDELNEQILLDYFKSVEVYADLASGKWRSTNDFSRKRIDALMPLSSNIYVPAYDKDNYMSIDSTTFGHDTVNILQGGVGWIVDRSVDKFAGRAYKVAWSPQSAIDTDPPNQSGSILLTIDKNANIELSIIGDLPLTVPYLPNNKNANTHLQYAAIVRSGGTITDVFPVGGERINLGNSLVSVLDSLGPVNSSFNKVEIELNGANTRLNLLAGQALSRGTGLLGDAGGDAPNTGVIENNINEVLIISVTRDNIIQSVSLDANTTHYEDPNNPGTMITLTNNRFKINFYKSFLVGLFIGEVLGQTQYLSLQASLDSSEEPDYPAITVGGVPINRLHVEANATNLQVDAALVDGPRIQLV